MNVLLWILQVLLALHTAVGAVWKWSNSEHTMPSLGAIPHGVWLGMSVLELLCVIALIVPAFSKRLAILAPIAATFVAAEMLFFSGVHLASGSTSNGQVFTATAHAGADAPRCMRRAHGDTGGLFPCCFCSIRCLRSSGFGSVFL